MSTDKNEFISTDEAGRILGINPFRVRQLCREERIIGERSRNSKNVIIWKVEKKSVLEYARTRKPVGRKSDRRKMNIYLNPAQMKELEKLISLKDSKLSGVRIQIANPSKEKK